MVVACEDCPLRKMKLFEDLDDEGLAFMQKFKSGETVLEAGTTLLMEGSNSPQLFTALEGMGLRYKRLPNGRRQVVNFIFPGDFIVLQAGVMGEMKHSVETATQMTLCVFDRAGIWTFFREQPERAFDLTWLASVEEYFLSGAMASIGQMTAAQRVFWGLMRFHTRCERLTLTTSNGSPFPFLHADLADALGLSPEHLSRTLSKLRKQQVVDVTEGVVRILDEDACRKIGMFEDDLPEQRRLI
ncbi:MAG: Crp/Fnr family transcriptional regulator [Paracoccaceae bacterium]